MVKTPEQYFQEQDFILPSSEGGGQNFTTAEQAFLQKYVGTEEAQALGIDLPPEGLEESNIVKVAEASIEEILKKQEQLQLIFFYIQNQLHTIPIEAVNEVIKFMTPMRLPLTPKYVHGVINLRGRITPLLQLEHFICSKPRKVSEESLIIVCQSKGIQLGIIIDKIHNMITVNQDDISWNVEANLGSTPTECLCGIVDYKDKIFGIISTDKIVDHIIQSRDIL